MTSPSCSMKPFLDPPNSKYDNYISSSNVTESANQSFGTAKATRMATIAEDSNSIVRPVFDPDHPAPDIATEDIGLREWSFLIDTFDGDAAIMIRPIRFKEKCHLGLDQNFVIWNDTIRVKFDGTGPKNIPICFLIRTYRK